MKLQHREKLLLITISLLAFVFYLFFSFFVLLRFLGVILMFSLPAILYFPVRMLLGVPFLPTISNSSWSSNKFENTFLHLFFALFSGYIAVALISIGIGIVTILNEIIKYIFSFNLAPHSLYNYSLSILGTAFAIGVVLAAIQDARKEQA